MIYASVSKRGNTLAEQSESFKRQAQFALACGKKGIRYQLMYTTQAGYTNHLSDLATFCAKRGLKLFLILSNRKSKPNDLTNSPTRPPADLWPQMVKDDQAVIDAVCKAYEALKLDPKVWIRFALGCEVGNGGVNGTLVWNGTSWVKDTTKVSGSYDKAIKDFLLYRVKFTNFRGCKVVGPLLECESPANSDGTFKTTSPFAQELKDLFTDGMKPMWAVCSFVGVNCYPSGGTPEEYELDGIKRHKVIAGEIAKRSNLPVIHTEGGLGPERCKLPDFNGTEKFMPAFDKFLALWPDGVDYQVQDHRDEEDRISYGWFDHLGNPRPKAKALMAEYGITPGVMA